MRSLIACHGILLLTYVPTFPHTTGTLDTHFDIVLSYNQAEPSGIVAAITTITSYACEGYLIQTRVLQNLDTVTIHIGGMIRPTPCFTAFSSATGTAFIGNLCNGIRYLKIQSRGENDLYKLSFEQRSVDITRIRSRFTELNGHLLYE